MSLWDQCEWLCEERYGKIYFYDHNVQVRYLSHEVVCMNDLMIYGH